jgi:hypothetical protein
MIHNLGFKSYLEIGLGFRPPLETYKHIKCEKKVGVDPHDIFANSSKEFFNMKSDEFFSHNTEMFDMIFIDGDHSEESVLKDISNSVKFLQKNGVIVLHDTGPIEFSQTASTASGTAYKAWMKVRRGVLSESFYCCSSLSSEDIYGNFVGEGNFDRGDVVGIMWRCNDVDTNILSVSQDSWDYYSNNRKLILNVVNPQEIVKLYLEHTKRIS